MTKSKVSELCSEIADSRNIADIDNKIEQLKVNKMIVSILLGLFTSSSIASEEVFFPSYNAWQESKTGCYLNGQQYQVGEIEAMNLEDLNDFKIETGFRASDGYAVMMMCSFLVEPSDEDYPLPNKRKFVWVAY